MYIGPYSDARRPELAALEMHVLPGSNRSRNKPESRNLFLYVYAATLQCVKAICCTGDC